MVGHLERVRAEGRRDGGDGVPRESAGGGTSDRCLERESRRRDVRQEDVVDHVTPVDLGADNS